MQEYKHLHKVIHDDVKDMKMYCEYAEDAIEREEKRLAGHFIDRCMERKHGMEQSLHMMEERKHQTEAEKMLHECMVKRLEEDIDAVDINLKEIRKKM